MTENRYNNLCSENAWCMNSKPFATEEETQYLIDEIEEYIEAKNLKIDVFWDTESTFFNPGKNIRVWICGVYDVVHTISKEFSEFFSEFVIFYEATTLTERKILKKHNILTPKIETNDVLEVIDEMYDWVEKPHNMNSKLQKFLISKLQSTLSCIREKNDYEDALTRIKAVGKVLEDYKNENKSFPAFLDDLKYVEELIETKYLKDSSKEESSLKKEKGVFMTLEERRAYRRGYLRGLREAHYDPADYWDEPDYDPDDIPNGVKVYDDDYDDVYVTTNCHGKPNPGYSDEDEIYVGSVRSRR